ncbi:MAG: RNA polymerase sigma-54 factor, partial [Spirochaetales bacterium]|nr:RNA polymerase sigma-54 factor [Spirochaetales bacterium]
LKTQIGQANDLIQQVELRNTTLEKVGVVLLDKQRDYFMYGPQFIHPLILKDVAEIVQVHETTISRITTSKYIDTDFGIIPIKLLFSSAVASDNNEDALSKNAVKDMIKELIEENTSGKALSDQKISDLLQTKGIKLARRTVAKYRKELDIDSSFIRG